MTTFSEAARPTLPKTLLAARLNQRSAASKEHLKLWHVFWQYLNACDYEIFKRSNEYAFTGIHPEDNICLH